jgi:hypothetical protein
MGNEHSQEAATQRSSDSESDDFDLSQIPDTRRNRPPSPSNTPTDLPEAEVTPAAPPPKSVSRKSQMPAARTHKRKIKKTKQPRANSKKKRRQSRTEDTQCESESEETAEVSVGPEEMAQQEEQRRIAEEGLARERMKRVRETEPEMFDDYALSDDSENEEDNGQDGAHKSKNPESDAGAIEGDDPSTVRIAEERPEEPDQDQVDSSQESRAESRSESEQSSEAVAVPEAVQETPFARPQKRKRSHATLSPGSPQRTKSSKKQRRKSTRSADEGSGIDVDDPADDVEESADRNDEDQGRATKRRQSLMDDFAQPYEKGSALRHLIYNPESPRRQKVAVLVPTTNTKPVAHKPRLENGESSRPSQTKPLHLKRRKSTSSEADVVSSPRRKDVWSLDNVVEPEGLATSTARRTAADSSDENTSDVEYQPPSPAPVQENTPDQTGLSEDRSDAENQSPRPDTNKSTTTKKRPRKGKTFARSSSATASTPKLPASSLRCRRCNQQFKTRGAMQKHMGDPTAHENLLGCDECEEEFATVAAFRRHRRETGHGGGKAQTGKTGRFTTDEADKLDRWRDMFCDEHGINNYEFNELMTAATKKGSTHWSYKFIDKKEFMHEYYAVLPGRDRRSMLRNRGRYSNADNSKFTEEDDADIVRLVGEIGQKWTEIGERLTRDPEKIRQRWKNKLQFGDTLISGNWDKEEDKRFRDAIKTVRRMSKSGDSPDEETFNWTAVSSMVKTRTPQQCANHWRGLHGTNIKGVWVDSGLDLIFKGKSPSKMEQRLAGKKLSEKRVEDSDSEEDNGEAQGLEKEQDVSGNSVEGEKEGGDSDSKVHDDNSNSASKSGSDGASEAEESDTNKGTPRRRPALEKTKTPAHALSFSQAFGETQAHSSAMKKSAKRRQKYGPSQDQPSPGIAVQVRPERSPEFGRRLQEVLNPTSQADGEDGGSEAEDEGQVSSSDPEGESPKQSGSAGSSGSKTPESDGQEVLETFDGERQPVVKGNGPEEFMPSPSRKKYSSRRKERREVRWPEDSDSERAADSE